jgi:hypothetical protein
VGDDDGQQHERYGEYEQGDEGQDQFGSLGSGRHVGKKSVLLTG